MVKNETILKTVVFAAGASVMMIEILSSRLIAPFFGSSTYVWSMIITVILASMTLGYRAGGRLADREPTKAKLSGILLKAAAVTLAIPVFAEFVLAIAYVILGWGVGAVVAPVILLSLPAYYLGMVSPYAVKLSVKGMDTVGSGVGEIYALSTVGSILGTLAAGFVLIPYMRMSTILYGVSAALLASSLLLSRSGKKEEKASVAVVLAAVMMFYEPPIIPVFGLDVIHYEYTPYGRIVVEEDNTTRHLEIDRGLEGAIRLDDGAGYTAYSYINYLELPFIVNPGIRNVLVAGEGAGVGPRQIIANHPGARVTVSEINPRVHEVAKRYFRMDGQEAVDVVIEDVRMTVKGGGQYDYIILDAFKDVSTIPSYLLTREFFKDVRTSLNDGGILLINIHSAIEGPRAIILKSALRTLHEHFAYTAVYALGEDASATQNIIVLASNTPLPPTEALMARAADTAVMNKSTITEMLGRRHTGEIGFGEGILFTDDYAPVERLVMETIRP